MSQDAYLLGRLAVHYKLINADQLSVILAEQAKEEWNKSLGDYLMERGFLTRAQLDKLLAVQREMLARQAAAQAAAAETAAKVPAKSGATLVRVVDRLLEFAVRHGASDLHLIPGRGVVVRRNGALTNVGEQPLQAAQIDRFLRELLDAPRLAELESRGQVDFSAQLAGHARFRGNAFRHQAGTSLSLRAIPFRVPSLADLGLPSNLARLTSYNQGIVLITGPAGCGKTSTLAALLRIVNEERRDHIVTIEDPIEYIHEPARCSVNQRQVGRDTASFARALKAALREDPDVIAIGELRDLETISLALTAAETGHLVLATLHTGSAIRTIDRIVGAFPPDQQPQVRTMFSESLRAVVSQRLANRADGSGRVPALEVLIGSRAVSNLIREQKTFQIHSILQTGAAQGMVLLDVSLAQLMRDRVITREEALRLCDDPKAIPAAAG